VLSTLFPSLKKKRRKKKKPPQIRLKLNLIRCFDDLIKACEKAEDAPFDVITVKACLVKAQKLVNEGILSQIG
jgi:hypothetical protein